MTRGLFSAGTSPGVGATRIAQGPQSMRRVAPCADHAAGPGARRPRPVLRVPLIARSAIVARRQKTGLPAPLGDRRFNTAGVSG